MHSCCNHSRSRSNVPVFNYFSPFAYLLSFPLLLLLTQIISVNQSRILTSWLPTVAPQTRRYSPLSAYRALRITRVLRGGLTYWVLQPPSLTDLLCQTAKHLLGEGEKWLSTGPNVVGSFLAKFCHTNLACLVCMVPLLLCDINSKLLMFSE